MAGRSLDAFVVEQELAALAPAALELSLAATERLEAERAALERLWQQRRERAAYEAERAARQYHAVDPDHRLVARSLERAWEDQLATRERLEQEHHCFQREQARVLTAEERAAIRQVAADIPSLWTAPTTTDADRKEILRQRPKGTRERLVVNVQGTTERVRVTLHWTGGEPTDGELIRPVARIDRLSTYPRLCERIRALAGEGLAAAALAERLGAEGYRPAKGAHFSVQEVRDLRRRLGVPAAPARPPSRAGLAPDEWWSSDLARELGMPKATLAAWIDQGQVYARHEDAPLHRWIIRADAAELIRLRHLRQQRPAERIRRRWLARPAQQPAGGPNALA